MHPSSVRKLSVRLEPAIAQVLFARAEAEDMSVSQVVRDALVEYLGVSRRRKTHIVPMAMQVSMAGTQFVTGMFNVRPGLITFETAREPAPVLLRDSYLWRRVLHRARPISSARIAQRPDPSIASSQRPSGTVPLD